MCFLLGQYHHHTVLSVNLKELTGHYCYDNKEDLTVF